MSSPPPVPLSSKPNNPSDDLTQKNIRTVNRLRSLRNQLSDRAFGDRLKGYVCIITGAGSKHGIGRASAFAFAHEGAAHIYALDFVADHLDELKETLQARYPHTKVTTTQGDASENGVIEELCKRAITDNGRLDVFFANAGIASAKSLQEMTPELFMKLLAVNTLSCFLAVKHASAAMTKTSPSKLESKGSIIMTASVAGIRSGAGDSAYSASKAAVNNLAQTSAYQLAGTQVRVNSICPGLIETGMTSEVFQSARSRGKDGKIGHLVPLQRYGLPEEIAQTAVFLGSDDSSFINGQNIAIDGGLSASHPVVPGKLA